MGKMKKIFFNIFLIIFTIFIVDISFFYYTYIKLQPNISSVKEYINVRKDIPSYFIKLNKYSDSYRKKYINDFRPIMNINSPESKSILIFGCSFAYGYTIDNKETISYIMSKYSDRTIYNRALMGNGIQHIIYQFKEDKRFFEQIKPPKYIFYVLMHYGGHFQRLYFTSFPNTLNKDYYFTYKIKDNKLYERKPLFNLYYQLAIIRHIYNKLVIKKVQLLQYKNSHYLFDDVVFYFKTANDIIKEYWGNDTKLIILGFPGNNIEVWKDKIEQYGIDYIDIQDIIGHDIMNVKSDYWAPDIDPHPTGALWNDLLPKLKEKYPDL